MLPSHQAQAAGWPALARRETKREQEGVQRERLQKVEVGAERGLERGAGKQTDIGERQCLETALARMPCRGGR